MLTRHLHFDWDAKKAEVNLRQHGVSFVDAAETLSDPEADVWQWESLDTKKEYNEDRWVTITTDPFDRNRVYVIVWTLRQRSDIQLTRIISARPATAKERRSYEEEIHPF